MFFKFYVKKSKDENINIYIFYYNFFLFPSFNKIC